MKNCIFVKGTASESVLSEAQAMFANHHNIAQNAKPLTPLV